MELTLPQLLEASSTALIAIVVMYFVRFMRGENKDRNSIQHTMLLIQQTMVKQDTERDKNLNLMREAMQQQTETLTQRTNADLALTDGIVAAIENNNKRMDTWVQTMSASLGSTNEMVQDTKTLAQQQNTTLRSIENTSTTTQTQTSKILYMLTEKHQKETDLSDKIDKLMEDRSHFDEAVLEEIRKEIGVIEKATQETVAVVKHMSEHIVINPPAPPDNEREKQAKPA